MPLVKYKFGGLFTEEEVEDVKPIFRFLLLLVAVLVPGLLFPESYDQLALHSTPTTVNLFECVCTSKETIYSVISFIFIPVYRFIVYPLVGKYCTSQAC